MRSWLRFLRFNKRSAIEGGLKQDVESLSHETQELLEKIRESVPSFIRQGKYETALKCLRAYLLIGWWCDTDSKFDTWADEQLNLIGLEYVRNYSPQNRRKIAYVTSGILAEGGLTQLLCNLILHHDHDKFDIQIIDNGFFPDSDPSCDRGILLKEKCQINSFGHDKGYVQSIISLADHVENEKIGLLVFLLSPDDIVSLTLPSIFPNIPSVFINASHHLFCGGSFQFNSFVDIQEYYYNESLETGRNTRCRYISQGARISPQRAKEVSARNLRAELGLPADSILTITVGNANKCLWRGDMSYVSIIAWMLEHYPKVHHIILARNPKPLIKAFAESHPRLAERIHTLETTLDIIPVLKSCDLYLNSYPLGGALSSVDAISAGIPVLFIKAHLPWFHLADQTAVDAIDYKRKLKQLLNDKTFRLRCVQNQDVLFKEVLDPSVVARKFEEEFLKVDIDNISSVPNKVSIGSVIPRIPHFARRFKKLKEELEGLFARGV